MGFLKKLGQNIIDVARMKKSFTRAFSEHTEDILGKHNFISNTLMSGHREITKAVNQVGGWDNLAIMAGSLLLGPAGTALTTGSGLLAGTSFASGLSAITGVTGTLGTTASIAGAVAAGYTGHQEHTANVAMKEAAAEEAKATAEYNAKVVAEEENARQARRAGLLATKKSLTKNITKGYQAGSGGAASTDLNVGSIVLG